MDSVSQTSDSTPTPAVASPGTESKAHTGDEAIAADQAENQVFSLQGALKALANDTTAVIHKLRTGGTLRVSTVDQPDARVRGRILTESCR